MMQQDLNHMQIRLGSTLFDTPKQKPWYSSSLEEASRSFPPLRSVGSYSPVEEEHLG